MSTPCRATTAQHAPLPIARRLPTFARAPTTSTKRNTTPKSHVPPKNKIGSGKSATTVRFSRAFLLAFATAREAAHDGRPRAHTSPSPNSPRRVALRTPAICLAPILRAPPTSSDGACSHDYTCQGRRRRRPHRTAPSGHGRARAAWAGTSGASGHGRGERLPDHGRATSTNAEFWRTSTAIISGLQQGHARLKPHKNDPNHCM